MKTLKYFFFLVDIGFIIYWGITYFEALPSEYLYSDYKNPMMVDWNWSFFPLDLCISFTGLTSYWQYRKGNKNWKNLALISLILTFTSGLQAIAFWAIRGDFDITWWGMNLFLMIYPLFFIPQFFSPKEATI